ncbi:helix-turn-helix domain-containing protein [Streptomyces sp. ST1015]|nr:helix-turn-helix domain-containing protein [Streptomyces sp. ST1015]
MGRREKRLEPADGPVQAFAHDLRLLRHKAGGLTYREMAALCSYSSTTLADAASGERLPSLPVLLAYVRACGATPPPGSGGGGRRARPSYGTTRGSRPTGGSRASTPSTTPCSSGGTSWSRRSWNGCGGCGSPCWWGRPGRGSPRCCGPASSPPCARRAGCGPYA